MQRPALPSRRREPTCFGDLLDSQRQGRVGLSCTTRQQVSALIQQPMACIAHAPGGRQQGMVLRHHLTRRRSSRCVQSFPSLPACIHHVPGCRQQGTVQRDHLTLGQQLLKGVNVEHACLLAGLAGVEVICHHSTPKALHTALGWCEQTTYRPGRGRLHHLPWQPCRGMPYTKEIVPCRPAQGQQLWQELRLRALQQNLRQLRGLCACIRSLARLAGSRGLPATERYRAEADHATRLACRVARLQQPPSRVCSSRHPPSGFDTQHCRCHRCL